MNKIRFSGIVASAVFAISFGSFVACSNDDDPSAPSHPPTPSPTEAGVDGSPGDPDGGEEADGGCFDAAQVRPRTPEQFLNQCNAAGCFPFDNARIEGYTPGAPLPPLN